MLTWATEGRRIAGAVYCTDCKAAGDKVVICDIGLYKILFWLARVLEKQNNM